MDKVVELLGLHGPGGWIWQYDTKPLQGRRSHVYLSLIISFFFFYFKCCLILQSRMWFRPGALQNRECPELTEDER